MDVFDEIERLRDQRTIGSLMRYLLDSNILRAYTTRHPTLKSQMAMALIPEQIGGALWIIFFASWVIVALISWLYFRGNTNIEQKRRFHKWSGIVYGTMFFFLVAITTVGLSFILLFF